MAEVFNFSFADRFRLVVEITKIESVFNYINNEYKNYKILNSDLIPIIGYLKESDSLKIPHESRTLVKGHLLEDGKSLYLKSGDKFAKIELNTNFFEISYQPNFEGSTLFSYLEVLIRLYAHKFNIDFFHAASFVFNNNVIMLNGFGGSGKTEIMLNALLKGATYISDDIVIVNENGVIFPYTVSIPIRWNAVNSDFIRKINVPQYIYKICEFCKQRDGKITRRVYGYLAWKYILNNYQYSQITDCVTRLDYYTVDYCLWLQTSNNEGHFNFSNHDFYQYMNLCLENESRKYFDFEGFLFLKFPEIIPFKQKREELRKQICNKLNIQGLGVSNKNYAETTNKILSSI